MIQVCGKWDHKRKRQNRFFLCVLFMCSPLGWHHLLKEWNISIILKYIELTALFLYVAGAHCVHPHTEAQLCCVFYNPSWWHIESIKRIFLCTINVLIWRYEPVIFQPIILQCERENAFLMQFYAKIHFKDINRSLALSSSLSKDSSSQNS